MVMKRRRFLRVLASGGVVLAAATLGLAAPAAKRLRSAAERGLRAPADLLARLRRKTKPLHHDDLYRPHDLAG
jgi:hypothetical protein